MNHFLSSWGRAAYTTAGFFWMAFWAFMLGYLLSSAIQVFVTKERMRKTMGGAGSKDVLLGTFFGFISSSCSFSALATTKSLFQKGASFVASIAFLLASTNLVIELGIIIAVFLGWQFVVGEYVGGILLILISWLLISIINPNSLIKQVRERLSGGEDNKMSQDSFRKKVQTSESWGRIGKQYFMEWKMVWKDVTIGFTIAGIVSAFVPDTFFRTLFINSGQGQETFGFFTLLEHVIVGPLAAFLTFIGSMGNIPLAALLFSKHVSFAGVMAFIFSDLVVFPVLRINARYYGWKMSFFILFLLFSSLIGTSLLLHYGFSLFDMLPDASAANILEQDHFKINYTFFLNLVFLLLSGIVLYFGFVRRRDVEQHMEMAPKSPLLENTLRWLAYLCYLWLSAGLIIHFFVAGS